MAQRGSLAAELRVGSKGRAPCRCPRSCKPPAKYSAMLPSTATVPWAGDACGHRRAIAGLTPKLPMAAPCSTGRARPGGTRTQLGWVEIPHSAAGTLSARGRRGAGLLSPCLEKGSGSAGGREGDVLPLLRLGISPNAAGMRLCHGESPTRPATASRQSASAPGLGSILMAGLGV